MRSSLAACALVALTCCKADTSGGDTPCAPGTYGANCGALCACENGGVCNDGVLGDGSCTCAAGFHGWRCNGTCDCRNGAACHDGAEGDGSCVCVPGFYDANCSTACACQNGSACTDGAFGDGTCLCAPGYWGPSCASACACESGGICSDGTSGDGACQCASGYYGAQCQIACATGWREQEGNPQISFGDVLPNSLWNDPSVLTSGAGFRMWLSRGDPTVVPIRVAVHEATSSDGASWTLGQSPVFGPAATGAWDDGRTETPNVIRVGSTYHLYYSGCPAPCDEGRYSIGHATSTDGTSWVRDPANPVITAQPDPSQWGFYTAAEPAAVFDSARGEMLLYYVAARSGPDGTEFGIHLAVSADGSTFTQHVDGAGNRQPALTRSNHYSPADGYAGYSTPYAIFHDGWFHLFYTVVVMPGGAFRQVALAHALSRDGRSYIEIEPDLLVADSGDWKDRECLSPAVLVKDGLFHLWFAGGVTLTSWDTYDYGIGYATRGVDCMP